MVFGVFRSEETLEELREEKGGKGRKTLEKKVVTK